MCCFPKPSFVFPNPREKHRTRTTIYKTSRKAKKISEETTSIKEEIEKGCLASKQTANLRNGSPNFEDGDKSHGISWSR